MVVPTAVSGPAPRDAGPTGTKRMRNRRRIKGNHVQGLAQAAEEREPSRVSCWAVPVLCRAIQSRRPLIQEVWSMTRVILAFVLFAALALPAAPVGAAELQVGDAAPVFSLPAS